MQKLNKYRTKESLRGSKLFYDTILLESDAFQRLKGCLTKDKGVYENIIAPFVFLVRLCF